MKFGRISFLKIADEVQTNVPLPSTDTSQRDTGLGQQNIQNPTQDTSKNTFNPSTSPSTTKSPEVMPKRRSLFKNLEDAKKEVKVFSSIIDNMLVLGRIKDVEWREEYTDRIPKKLNLYRYVAYDTDNNPTHYLMLRGDVPSPLGPYRLVIDKIGHAGMAKAKYFKTAEELKNYVSKNYEIDVSGVEFVSVDKESMFTYYVEKLRGRNGVVFLNQLTESEDMEDEEKKEFITEVIKEALKDMPGQLAADLITAIEELPIDLSEEKKKYKRFLLSFKKDKDKYQEMFKETVPFLLKEPTLINAVKDAEGKVKLKGVIPRLVNEVVMNQENYTDLIKNMKTKKTEITNRTNKPITVNDIGRLVIPANDFIVVPSTLTADSEDLKKLVDNEQLSVTVSTGIHAYELNKYLRDKGVYDNFLMNLAGEIAKDDAGNSKIYLNITLDIKNKKKKTITIDDIEGDPIVIPANGIVPIHKDVLRNSTKLRSGIKDGDLIVIKDTQKEQGFISEDELDEIFDYVKGVRDTYMKYQDKKFKPFEHKYRIDPFDDNSDTYWWRSKELRGKGTFVQRIDMGDIYTPIPSQLANVSSVNEHVKDSIAFAITHELFLEDKKVWIIDEYQSDLVQQAEHLSDQKMEVSVYNPEGKSQRELYMSAIQNYYSDWYKVFFNRIIKKAKMAGVDEVWLIRGSDIFDLWLSHNQFPDVAEAMANDMPESEIQKRRERHLRLFRKVYDETAIEYSQYLDDPEKQKLFEEYNALASTLGSYFNKESVVSNFLLDYNKIDKSEVRDLSKAANPKYYADLLEKTLPKLQGSYHRTQTIIADLNNMINDLRGKAEAPNVELQNRLKEVGKNFGELVQKSRQPQLTKEQKDELNRQIEQVKQEQNQIKMEMSQSRGTDVDKQISDLKTKLKEAEKKEKELVDILDKASFIRTKWDDVLKIKDKMEGIMQEVSVIKDKPSQLPEKGVNAGKYHVIDVNKIPDERLAKIERGIIKYAEGTVDFEYWKQHAENWITETFIPRYRATAKQMGEELASPKFEKIMGLMRFWEEEIPADLAKNKELLMAIRDHLRVKWGMPNLDWTGNAKFYAYGELSSSVKYAGDNPDPSYPDAQTSPMEESFSNRLVNPDDVLYRRKKGRGGPMSPEDGGDLRTNLPASVQNKGRTASDVVERFLITREKQHVSEPQIKQELKDKGVPEQEISDTYKNRDKNLYKKIS